MSSLLQKENYIKLILYLVVIVLINIAGITLFFRADLTQNKMFSLSEASRQAVSTLSEPLTIKAFFSKDLPAPHNNTERYLKDLLNEYASRAGNMFNYSFYSIPSDAADPEGSQDDRKKLAADYGISPVQIRMVDNDEFKSRLAYMGLVIIHGDLIEKIPAITSTDGLEYKLTTAIRKLNSKVSALMRLDEKIRITLYLSSSLNTIAPYINLDRLPQLAGSVEKLVENINTKSMGQIEFKREDVTDKETMEAISEEYEIMALNWPDVPEKDIQAGHGMAGMVISYKDQVKTLPLISAVELPIIGTTYQMAEMETLEDTITATMEKMIGINKNIGYLSGHGTHSLVPDRMAMMQGRPGGGLQAFNSLVSRRYNIRQVNLKEEPVPMGLNCLIIARPTEPFTDYELLQIDQALMNGTNIAFFTDAVNEIMPQQGGFGMPPQYVPMDTGLEKLLNHYGVDMTSAYVMDKSCYVHNNPQSQGGGDQEIYFAPRLKENSINNEPAYMKNIKGLIAMQISPLDLATDNLEQHDVQVDKLLFSSDEAWLLQDNIQLNPMYITPPQTDEEFSRYDLSYMLHGTFTSYFKGKTLPVKESGETNTQDSSSETDPENKIDTLEDVEQSPVMTEITPENVFVEQSKPAKIFILPCSQMLADTMLDPEGRSTNATFILNIIDHLNGQDSIAALRSKQQTLNPLEETTGTYRAFIKIFTIAGLPGLVILFGLGIWIRRTARKKKIKQMFSS